jgi:transposase
MSFSVKEQSVKAKLKDGSRSSIRATQTWKMKKEEVGHPISMMPTDRLKAAIKAKRPRKKNHVVFHHDDAQPHVEERVVQSINDKGWGLLKHPPYSPTEAPTEYHVNRSLKNWKMGKVYNDSDEVADVKVWICFQGSSLLCPRN